MEMRGTEYNINGMHNHVSSLSVLYVNIVETKISLELDYFYMIA